MSQVGGPDVTMQMKNPKCPFKIGDQVVFVPHRHTTGWYQHAWDRFRTKPGDSANVTRIDRGQYLYFDAERGGFHWEYLKNAS
jgi:hypothetical protein